MLPEDDKSTVVSLDQFRRTGSSSGTASVDPRPQYERTLTGQLQDAKNEGIVPFDRLYPLGSKFSKTYYATYNLLKEGLSLCDEAIDAERSGDFLLADELMQGIKNVLSEVFAFRQDFPGIAYLAVSVFQAIRNKSGQPFTEDEMTCIRLALYRAVENPVLGRDMALNLVMAIEDGGLTVEPPEIAMLAEALHDESAG